MPSQTAIDVQSMAKGTIMSEMADILIRANSNRIDQIPTTSPNR